jgi:transcriptional activator of cad operon
LSNRKDIDLAKPFYLNSYLVNPITGVVMHGKAETNLEPKVMLVLLILVRNTDELVTQEEIFDQVWPNSIFSSSSIQRCITILRKIFADDAKIQAVIKTHPKRGYSLHAKLTQLRKSETINGKKIIYSALLVLTILILVFIGKSQFSQPDGDFSKVELSPLSSTENNEYFARYSPNLKYVAYIQETIKGKSDIWLRNNQTDEHAQLTFNGIEKLSLTWSRDNQTILFSELEYINSKPVFHIKRIGIKGFNKSASVKLITNIENLFFVGDIFWSSESHIFYVARAAQGQNVFKHNLVTNEATTLLEFKEELVPQSVSLSDDGKKLAVILQDTQMYNHLKILDVDGKLLEDKGNIEPGDLEIDWHPNNRNLLINSGKKLSIISSGSENTKQSVNYASLSSIADVSFAGENKISFTLDKVDADIYRYELNKISSNAELIINSNKIDNSARLSVNGTKIAFISRRSGSSQIFFRERDKEHLIYKNEKDALYLSAPLWRDEESIFIAVDGRLSSLDINNRNINSIQFSEDKYILHLLSWNVVNKTINLAYKQDDSVYIAAFNLQDQAVKIIRKLKPEQAAHTFSDNKIVLIKSDGLFEIRNSNKEVLLVSPQVDNIDMSVGRKSGIYYQSQLNAVHTLWHLSYPEKKVSKIFDVPANQLLIDISEDEQTALFRSIVHEKDIVVIKNIP